MWWKEKADSKKAALKLETEQQMEQPDSSG
jgi:hypothetical protein